MKLSSLPNKKNWSDNMERHYDVVIVGAGPGGLQLALTLQEISAKYEKDIKYVILEKGDSPGQSFKTYPVHGKLISNNKLYTGYPPEHPISERYDWNSLITEDKKILMRHYSTEFHPNRESLVEMLNDIVKEYKVPVDYNTIWKQTTKDENGEFVIQTNHGTYHAKYLVVATGLTVRDSGIPGAETATLYRDMKPKEHYRDKRVLIIGKGNSAMEAGQDIMNEANTIMLASRGSAKMAYQTHYVGHIRAVNSFLVENYQLKHQAALLDCHIKQIEKVEDGYNVSVEYCHADGECETLFFNEVILATGFKPDLDQLIKDFGIQIMNEKFPSINGKFESTEVENLYFAGAATHGLDFRKNASGFIHGFRYNSKVLAHILAEELGIQVEQQRIENHELISYILHELNHSPDIFLQAGFISHVLEYKDGGWYVIGNRTINDFNDMQEKKEQYILGITMEYGSFEHVTDVLNIERKPHNAASSTFVHPVLRLKTNGDEATFHLSEHLEANYMSDKYAEDLKGFFNNYITV